MSEIFTENLFKMDYKVLHDELTEEIPIIRLLQRYFLGIGDYENNILSEAIFIRLGWSNKYKDTIINAYFIYLSILSIISRNENCKCKYMCDWNDGKLHYKKREELEYNEDIYYSKKETIVKNSLDKKYFLNELLVAISNEEDIYRKLNELAKLNDSLSNFTPHPGYPFNQAKGCIPEVADSLNLMVDKIQKCIDDKSNMSYGKYGVINLDKLKEWKEWFIKNRSVYFLDAFYSVTGEGKIKGTKLFSGQSLDCPLPNNENDVLKSLQEINKLLSERANKMSNSFR